MSTLTSPILTWTSRNAALPKVIVYITGGTIICASRYSRLDSLDYGEVTDPPPSIDELIRDVDEVLDIAQLAIVHLPRAPSNDLTSDCYVGISKHFAVHGAPEESGVAGGVVVHGTNTLTESIFGLDLTLSGPKPFVAVGSLRPLRGLSSDAYLNFYQAVSVAVSPSSRNRGALVVFNDNITSAYFAKKSHSTNPATFVAQEQGHLGYIFAGQPYYFYEPARPTGKLHFDLERVERVLPKVDILYAHLEFDATMMQAAVDTGSKGVVVVGLGSGDLSRPGEAAIEQLVTAGIPVIVAARPYNGSAFPKVHPSKKINSNFMSAEHARIQLQLCLAIGMSHDDIREAFEGHFRRAIYNTSGTKFYDVQRETPNK